MFSSEFPVMAGGGGDVLLVLRRAADITQEELASRLGVTQAALSRYENDNRGVIRGMG
jgi:transcriptional regulator with XRE-family HTH domain